MENVYRSEADPCPYCGHLIDSHTSLNAPEMIPKSGDVSICAKCAGWNKYDENIRLVKLGEEDILKIKTEEPEVIKEMEGISDMIRKRNSKVN